MRERTKSKGVLISEYRVRRLMRENGVYPELAVKFKPQRNGKSDGRYPACKECLRECNWKEGNS